MGHHIAGVIIRGTLRKTELTNFDTNAVTLMPELSLVWMDHVYSEYWAHRLGHTDWLTLPSRITDSQCVMLPREQVVLELVRRFCARRPSLYAVVFTDYHGGMGDQIGLAYEDERPLPGDGTINAALRSLGVRAAQGLDEFDTAGLSEHRSIPDDVLDIWCEYPEL